MIANELRTKLLRYKRNGLYRSRKSHPHLTKVKKPFLAFSSNDYLGLASHPEIISGHQKALSQFGICGCASAVAGGYTKTHRALEKELAEFLDYKDTIIFSSGYMANLGLLTTVAKKNSHVFMDRLNHASLVDGCRYSGASFTRYQHCNMHDLTTKITHSIGKNFLFCTDGVFSMDGDLAPLVKLAEIAKKNNGSLIVDDAHGIGVIGEQGKGIVSHYQLTSQDVPILVGTFSKAFGSFGAFVAGDKTLTSALANFARSYIYTTALPQPLIAATRISLKIMQAEDWRRHHLTTLINRFRLGAKQLNLKLLPSDTPIQPIIIGELKKAQLVALQLKHTGILVSLIRPPTVPPNTTRLRISFNANHSFADIDFLLATLSKILGKDHE